MARKMMMVVLLVMFLGVATHSFAEDVYVTKNGKKYHKEDCRLVKNKKPIAVDRATALKNNLAPCGLCFKDEISKMGQKTNKLEKSK